MISFELRGTSPAVLPTRDLSRVGRALAKRLRLKKPYAIGLAFIPPAKMQMLNRNFRGKDRVTDVLSFPSIDIPLPKTAQNQEGKHLGDIAICPSYAKSEAKRRGIPLKEELVRLLIHGVLHLKGYDHATELEETRMFGLQEHILGSVMK